MPLVVNPLEQTSQKNGFSFVWMRKCTFRCASCRNLLKQTPQTCFFPPEWNRLRCVFKYPSQENFLGQKLQINGFSFVWVRWCTFKAFLLGYLSENISEFCGFFSVWYRKCNVRCRLLLYTLPHTSHANNGFSGLFFVWVL